MKKGKLLLLAITSAVVCIAATACGHSHEFGEWSVATEPTLTTGGKATRTCVDGDKTEEVDLPVLSDAEFWSVSTNPATHTQDGSTVYSNAEYDLTVSVTLPATGHEFDGAAWTITSTPDENTPGSAVRHCTANDGGISEPLTLPALSDTDFWTYTVIQAAGHVADGSAKYENAQYALTVPVTLPAEEHEFDGAAWTITANPTQTEPGSAERYCTANDGGKDLLTLPALSDTDFWTYTVVNPAGHGADGSAKYENAQYSLTVPVTLPATGHEYDGAAWTVTAYPTQTQTGSAERYCTANDGGKEDLTLPVLSDTTFWTVSASVAADYNQAGYTDYANAEYGFTYREEGNPKLVAPYDNKTYYGMAFDASESEKTNKEIGFEDAWVNQHVTLDANAEGICDGALFGINKASYKITMKDYAAGLIEVTVGDNAPFTAYLDTASGIFVQPRQGSFNHCLVATYYETDATRSGCAKASAFTVGGKDAMAIAYTAPDNTVYHIFIYNEHVYFNVTFSDLAGGEIAAENAYNAAALIVKQGDNQLFAFGYNGTEVVELDGKQGTYTGELETGVSVTLNVTGFGTVTVGEDAGTYVVLESGKIGVTLNGAYYEVTLGDGTFTAVKPMVTITFNAGDHASGGTVTTNKNIACTLPVPVSSDDGVVFRGWFCESDFSGTALGENYVPTASVTLYAKWVQKVTLHVYVHETATTVYVGVGDLVSDILAQFEDQLAATETHYFDGWFIDAAFENSLPEDVEVPEDLPENTFSLYAKWTVSRVYYGEYYGANTYGKEKGTGGSEKLSLDLYGNMTGKWTGKVVSYDAESQLLTVEASGGTNYYFWYDPASGVLVSAHFNSPTSPEIGNDTYTFVKGATSGNAIKTSFAITYRLHNGTVSTSTSSNYYTRFLTVNQPDGSTKAVLIYNDRIYSDIKIEKPDGTLVAVEDVKNQKSIIVKDSLGNVLLAVAATANTFNTEGVKQLDNYYGVYTAGESTVVLDGVGGISFDGKTGTYTAVEGKEYGFDVYLANRTEYWQLTLNTTDKTCTIVKPTIALVLVSAHSTHDNVTLNINVVYSALPAPKAEGFVFRGWYTEESCENKITSYTADGSVETVTLYAKWLAEVTLTTNFNYEGAPEAVRYDGIGTGETFTVEKPVRAGYKFLGWYTAQTEGELWVSDSSTIAANLVVFAHWEVAEPYYNTYDLYYVSGSTANGAQESLYHRTSGSGYFIIDADGNQTGFSASPFTYFCFIKDYVKNTEEGYATFKFQTYASSSDKVGTGKVYSAYLQLSTGIIVMSYRDDATTTGSVWDGVYVLFPMQNGTVPYTTEKTSYWNGGLIRTISYKDGEGELHSVFIENGEVFFDVTFMSAQTEGTAVAAENCYQAETVYILQNGVTISSYGYNGTTMIANDGLQGTYTLEGNADLVLNGFGKFTLGAKGGVYSIVAENTLDAFVLVDGVRTEHYTITLSASAYTFVENTVNHVIGQNPNTGSKEYNFVYDEENGYYYSANGGVSSSYSRMTVTALMAGTLTLEYQVSSESSDPLYFCLNTSSTYSPITKASGANGLSSGDSPDDSKWVTFTRELAQGDVIWIIYYKDSGVDTGADTAWIRNVRYVAFDMKVAGDYTGTEGTVNLNGKGAITLGDKSGTYEKTAEGIYDVFFKNTSGVAVSHFTLTIDTSAMTYTLTPVTTTVEFEMNGHGTAPSVIAYTLSLVALPAPEEVEGFIFRGWTLTQGGTEYVTEIRLADEPVTVYAAWDTALSVTFNYGKSAIENCTVYFGTGDVVTLSDYAPETIYLNGQLFVGFTDAEGNDITTVTVTKSVTVTAKWEARDPFAIDLSPSTSLINESNKKGFTEDAGNGWYQSANTGVNSSTGTMTITAYAPGTLSLQWYVSSEGSTYDYVRIYRNTSSNELAAGGGTGDTTWHDLTVDLEAGDVIWIIYRKDSSSNKGDDCARIRNIEFAMFDLSVAGDYAGTEGTVNLNGKGVITLTSGETVTTGSYEKTAEGAYDVFFKNGDGEKVSRYTLTIDVAEKTYTLVARTVTVDFEMNELGTAPVCGTVYAGIAYELPQPASVSGWLFLGWYENSDFSGNAVTSVTATSAITLYAKWTEAYTLTIIYDAHGEVAERTVTHEIACGDTVNLNTYKPVYDNGYSFDKWLVGSASGAEVTETSFTMDSAKTFYAVYTAGAAYLVELAGPSASDNVFIEQADGSYKTTVGTSPRYTYIAVQINVTGTLTFQWRAVDDTYSEWGVYSRLEYYRYDSNGNQIGNVVPIGGATELTYGSLDTQDWKNASISVEAGQTIYVAFYKDSDAGSSTAAAVKDFALTPAE